MTNGNVYKVLLGFAATVIVVLFGITYNALGDKIATTNKRIDQNVLAINNNQQDIRDMERQLPVLIEQVKELNAKIDRLLEEK